MKMMQTKTPKRPTSRGHVLEVMAKLHGWGSIVELGVWKAGTAEFLLTNCPRLHWYGVDSYDYQTGEPTEIGFNHYYGSQQERYEEAFVRLRPFSARSRLFKERTVEAAQRFADESVDAVFVDADHRYAAVVADIGAWWPKIREGGWMLGHDYELPSVRRAVADSFPEPPLELPDRVWAVKK